MNILDLMALTDMAESAEHPVFVRSMGPATAASVRRLFLALRAARSRRLVFA